jgi:pimeloyl-ACP methyl ester carboxylesterase
MPPPDDNRPPLSPEKMQVNLGVRGTFSYLEWDHAPLDTPHLHFAHANGFNANTYRQLLGPLAPDFHITAWDARGHGRTTAPANPNMLGHDWTVFRDDLKAFIEHHGKPIWLAGHSLGAVVSMELAVTGHPLVQGLILVDPVFLPRRILHIWGPMKRLGLAYHLPLAARALKRRAEWSSLAEIEESYCCRGGFKTWADPNMLRDYLAAGTRNLANGGVELTCTPAWEAAVFAATPHRVWRELAQLTRPLTLLYGTNSDTFMRPAARLLPKTVPQARLIPVPDTTHFVPMEQPETVRQAIRDTVKMR